MKEIINNSCKTVIITSFKGGVGKSTVTANLSMTLAQLNFRVLALDCDFSMRCLDLIMGYESSVVYDICDIIADRIAPERAVINDTRNKNLFFCAAPYKFNGSLDAGKFTESLKKLQIYSGWIISSSIRPATLLHRCRP